MPPGKLGPRLVQDLLHYDPRYEAQAPRNILIDPPPHYDPDDTPGFAVPRQSCTHDLVLKPEQSSLVPGSDDASQRTVACLCTKCRLHVDITITCDDDDAGGARPCHLKDASRPLHHFCPAPEPWNGHNGVHQRDSFSWQCSLPRCPVKLTIKWRPARFSDHDIELLSDEKHLQKRWERSQALSPGRSDPHPARPVDALDYLTSYLMDSFHPKPGKNRIPLLNRKFLKTFGEDCDHILTSLGFEQVLEPSEEGEDGSGIRYWHLPNTSPEAADAMDHVVIEDAIYELKAILMRYTMQQRAGTRNPHSNLRPALPTIENVLGFPQLEYSQRLVSWKRSGRDEEEHPHYAGLGAVAEFGDDLIAFAFKSQKEADLANAPYYLECLKGIAMGRQSDKLSTEVQLLRSQGCKTSGEVTSACKELGLDMHKMRELTDDDILGHFSARLTDSGPSAKLKLREALDVIGSVRDSGKLIRAASESLDTYEDALRYLDLTDDRNDEWVTLMYHQKCSNDPTSEPTARRAVQLIAHHRRSDILLDFLNTGELGSQPMEIGEAYALLGIKDRTQAPDLDVLETQRDELTKDDPSNAERLMQAFDLVREDVARNLAQPIQNSNMGPPPLHSLETWPVGCRNLGNTCYLNSVLQFLFTIKPLRNRILHCDDYFQDRSLDALENKWVTSKVTPDMVEHGQKFVLELKQFFAQMITANTDSVRPDMELACLALDKVSAAEAAAAAESPRKGTDETLLEPLGGLAVQGPVPKPLTPESSPRLVDDQPKEKEKEGESPQDTTDEINMPETKDNNKPPGSGDKIMDDGNASIDSDRNAKIDVRVEKGVGADAEMDDDASSTKAEPDEDASSTIVEMDQDGDHEMEDVGTDANANAPARELPAVPARQPPPIPPRPTQVLSRIEEAARQQDANDILLRIFDLFSYAFKGEGVMGEDGEQYDIVKELFFLINKEVSMSDGKSVVKTESCHHVVPGGLDRPLLEALEESFAPEEDSKGMKYSYIEKAPPIMLIAIGRVSWENRESVRDNSHLALEEVLYMDRFLGQTATMPHDKLQTRRQEFWELNKQRCVLQEKFAQSIIPNRDDPKGNPTVPDALGVTAEYLERMNAKESEKLIDVGDDDDGWPTFPDLPADLRDRQSEVVHEYESYIREIADLDNAINGHWEELKEEPYRLHAIFMHRGSAAGGHYWIYIFDFQNKIWREYNDETVREVSTEQVYKQQERASSTVVVYVREEIAEQYTEAVFRKPGAPLDSIVFGSGSLGEQAAHRISPATATGSTGDVEMTPPPEPEHADQDQDVAMGSGSGSGSGRHTPDSVIASDNIDAGASQPMSDVQVIEGIDPTR